MKKVSLSRILILNILCLSLAAEEFPVMVYHEPYSTDTSRMSIDTSYSHLVEFGATHIGGWVTPLTAQKANEYGLKLIAENAINSNNSSGTLTKNLLRISDRSVKYLHYFAKDGLFMDLEIESDQTLNGYFFDVNGQVGEESANGYFCDVDLNSEGYLFDKLGWGDSRDSLSIYAFLTKDDDLDSCNADFYLKIPSLANPSAKVCVIDVKNRKTGYNILAIDTIYVSDFSHANSFEVFPLRFLQKEWIEEDTQYTYIYLSTGLYWFDEVDLEIDKIRVYNPKGKTFFEDIPGDTIDDSLSNYFANLAPYQSVVHSYYLADEPRGGSIPAIQFSDVLLRNNSSPDVHALSNMPAYNWYSYTLTEVYAKIVQPPAVLADYYWYRCGMPLATDTCMTCWRYQCGDPCWNVQYPISRFTSALDSMYNKSNRQNREFWSVLGSARFNRCPKDGDFCFWDLEDPNEEVFKVSIYLSLAHGARGISFWTYGSYGFSTDTVQQNYEPESYNPEISEESIRDTCPCDIPEECIHYDGNQPTVGLYDWDPVNQVYTRNSKWYTLKNILDRAKPMGSILRECELIDVGLIDSGSVGFIDSVSGTYDPDWIEASVFQDGSEYYFMLVNRRLLQSESTYVKVYLDEVQFVAPKLLVDVYSEEEFIFNWYETELPPYFYVKIYPGEGRLFRFDPLVLTCGDVNADGLINVTDAVFLTNYIFLKGLKPDPIDPADANCDGSVNISDAIIIINYVFVGGFLPCDPNGDGILDC